MTPRSAASRAKSSCRRSQQAKDARLYILDKITEAISAPREALSQYAPRIITIHIDPEQIGAVIGPGGKTIKKITADTGAKIDIEQDGTVYIAAVDGAAGEPARKAVEDLTRTIKPGEIYEGTVVRFLQFGAFVEIIPGKDGLVHVSQLTDSDERIGKPEDVVKLGDKLRVRVTEVDSQGRVNLTARGLDQPFDPANPEPGRPPRPAAAAVAVVIAADVAETVADAAVSVAVEIAADAAAVSAAATANAASAPFTLRPRIPKAPAMSPPFPRLPRPTTKPPAPASGPSGKRVKQAGT